MSNLLFPNLRIVLGFMDGCYWCQRFKETTLPMVKALGIRYQIITEDAHLSRYNAEEYGFPLVVIADKKGYPLYTHGGYLTLEELMQLLNETHDQYFKYHEKNRSVASKNL